MAELPELALDEGHKRIVLAILKHRIPERRVLAFGSRVDGSAKPYSDLELAILGDTPLPLDTLAALREDFEQSDLPWRVYLVEAATARAAFKALILARYVVLQPGNP